MKHPAHQFARLRQQMVIEQLRARGIRDARVLSAMLAVPREAFVPEAVKEEAYADWPQPIGAGQTISQPFTVAYMAEAAELRGDEKILEVGTGSGYGAAVLSHLGAEVHTIERLPALAERATETLERLGYSNVHVYIGDGSLGLAEQAPFDAIVVTAGGAYLPPAYSEQLAEGGCIVIPIGRSERNQHLYRFRRARRGSEKTGPAPSGGASFPSDSSSCEAPLPMFSPPQCELSVDDLGAFAFVPLIGEAGWHLA